jgi:hypothetical protein
MLSVPILEKSETPKRKKDPYTVNDHLLHACAGKSSEVRFHFKLTPFFCLAGDLETTKRLLETEGALINFKKETYPTSPIINLGDTPLR